MRAQKQVAVVTVALVAGLSLTACQGGGSSHSGSRHSGTGKSGHSRTSTHKTTTHRKSVRGAAAGAGAGAVGSSRSSGHNCTTSGLGFSTSGGMGEGTLIVNLKNTGSVSCTSQGFPGVDLAGKDGTVSATRSKLGTPHVIVPSGQETRFTLHFTPNTGGGSGTTFTRLVVTPPGETHSTTLPVHLNVGVFDSTTPTITVDPVGTGK
ncbi:DUF4232 domain-containing protein [Streptomyces sp. B3I8]|uniref:DUF4232 domain-containing protein n=1 Tax=Streptomyces sp. B3I8 TaxID=3042303 RepID=UPI002787A700|nr:DUF4232 domain-containing protein [Streptomyces sp. B3I8]MDQ0788472.1 hypothetical protein [Streptomyces sp. B3I8]